MYTSKNNKKLKEYKKLLQKKYRDEMNMFLVEGYHLVKEAYDAKILKTVILTNDIDIDIDVPKVHVDESYIKELSDVKTSQNIIGVCEKKEEKEIKNKVIILDDIQDPGNLGTIIRSSAAFNFDTIILSEKSVDLYNPKVIRSSQGMLFKVNIIRTNLKEIITDLKKKGYYVLSTKVTDGKNIKTLEKKEKICIIMGNEGNGVSDEISSLSDDFVYIKMNEKCESLNVGVATSILLYELGSD